MAAKMGDGVPGIKYGTRGVMHLATAKGYSGSLTACNRICYGSPTEVKPEEITCKACAKRI